MDVPLVWNAHTVRDCLAKTLPLAYSSAFTMATIQAGFRDAGLWPVDPSVIAPNLHHAEAKAVSTSPLLPQQPQKSQPTPARSCFFLLFFFFLLTLLSFLPLNFFSYHYFSHIYFSFL
jgi:hypothetical protein